MIARWFWTRIISRITEAHGWFAVWNKDPVSTADGMVVTFTKGLHEVNETRWRDYVDAACWSPEDYAWPGIRVQDGTTQEISWDFISGRYLYDPVEEYISLPTEQIQPYVWDPRYLTAHVPHAWYGAVVAESVAPLESVTPTRTLELIDGRYLYDVGEFVNTRSVENPPHPGSYVYDPRFEGTPT